MFNGHWHPRLKLDCSPVYPGMTAGVCWMSISSGTIKAPFSFEQEDNNLEVNLSEQSVIDSHHQQ